MSALFYTREWGGGSRLVKISLGPDKKTISKKKP